MKLNRPPSAKRPKRPKRLSPHTGGRKTTVIKKVNKNKDMDTQMFMEEEINE